MPPEVSLPTYRNNKEFYDEILKNLKPESREQARAAILLVSGCQENQLSADGDFNGLFTAQLLRVWREGTFTGTTRCSTRRLESACRQTRLPITSERDKSTSNLKLRLRLRSNWLSGAAWERYHQREGGA